MPLLDANSKKKSMTIIKSNKAAGDRHMRSPYSGAKKKLVGPLPVDIQQNDAGHSVKVNRTGDHVDSIEVTCACGCQIMVRCEYE